MTDPDRATLLRLRAELTGLRDGPHDERWRAARDRQNTWMAAAYRHGYTLQAMGNVLMLTRERIRRLVLEAVDGLDVPPVAGVPDDLPTPTVPPHWARYPRPTLTADEVNELLELQRHATGLRGNMRPEHPARVASERLTALLLHLADERGFTYGELAAVLGVDKNTVRARLKRHGHRGGSAPSQKLYQGRRTPTGGTT